MVGPVAAEVRSSARVHDVIVTLSCVALAVLVGLVSYGYVIDEDPTPPSDLWLDVDLGIGIVACLAVIWRHRWPVVLAIAVLAASVVSASAAGAAAVLVYTLGAERRSAVAATVVGGFAVASPTFHLARARTDLHYYEGPVLAFGLLLVASVLLGMYVQARRQLTRSRLAEAEREVHNARRDERTRIAREMHDVLAHRLSLVSMHAGALELRPEAEPEKLALAAAVVRENAHQALQDLRDVIGVLRDDVAEAPGPPQPVLADLPELVEASRAAGVSVRTDLRLADLATVPTALGRTAYRIVQEALTNALKHAGGGAVSLTVAGERGGELTVEVRNPMPTAPAPVIPGGGTGLVGLVERAELAGGRLEYGPTADGDFRLHASLRWDE